MDKVKEDSRVELKFIGIDFWNRAQFIDQKGNYFGNVNMLFDYGISFETLTDPDEVQSLSEEDIVYFGREPDCDPDGTLINSKKIKLVKEFTLNERQ